MPRPKTKTKSEDLIRTRNNQRRSRAHRREYIESLEKKIKQYENLLTIKDQVHEKSLNDLRTENGSLRELLDALGSYDGASNEHTIHTGMDIQIPTFPTAISPQTMGSIFIDSPTTQPSISHLDLSFNQTQQLLLEGPSNPQDTIDFSPRELQLPFIGVNSPQYFEALDQSAFCPNDLWKAEMTTKTSGNDNKRTTLCSLAFRLVAQCNKRGVDLQVIHIWMQHGFQLAMASNEGCRVDNQVLLDILTQIS